MNWDELREMGASGVVDVQSHTFYHHQVWVDSVVIDFMKPGQWLPFVRRDDELAPGGEPMPAPAVWEQNRPPAAPCTWATSWAKRLYSKNFRSKAIIS